MESVETIEVQNRAVSCDGDVETSSHPRVYLEINDGGDVVCPYCSKRYVLAEGATDSGGH
ncbi:MAG: zinc-finger domain-containing protein [Rhodospirillales bacterium]|nr:zinc-finger domain-containing protein [Rhodospirillales bacterium]